MQSPVPSAEPVTIAGDPELLRRAVENVLRNAIRYAPRDTTVEVKLSRNAAGAVVEIRDHGQGVPEDALPRIFDPFYRVESDRNRLSGGIGLGLSIARRAVELHKGAIRAERPSGSANRYGVPRGVGRKKNCFSPSRGPAYGWSVRE